MGRVLNFSAGPGALPQEVLEQVRDEMLDWQGAGMSVMEMSHRGKAFVGIAARAEEDLRKLMQIPDNYRVLFLQGGATGQFAAIPQNLLGDKGKADYVNTGSWSAKAIAEARNYCEVNVVAEGGKNAPLGIPLQSEWRTDPEAAYLHYTPNETISGVEFHWVPETGEVPLVADMSSTILSRPVDVSKYGLIYAGAQKNIGPAGLVIVIVRDDLLGKAAATTPSILNYQKQAEADSMSNTPPTFAWYVAGLVFQWVLRNGGLEGMAERNRRKAEKLYAFIDQSGLYRNPVEEASRSWMNVPFVLADDGLDKGFLAGAEEAGLATLKGHRSVGGMRASIYNALDEDAVDALIEYMQEFERRHG